MYLFKELNDEKVTLKIRDFLICFNLEFLVKSSSEAQSVTQPREMGFQVACWLWARGSHILPLYPRHPQDLGLQTLQTLGWMTDVVQHLNQIPLFSKW